MVPVCMRDVIEASEEILSGFEDVVNKSSPYEAKGIFNSELLMLCAVASRLGVKCIIESGRARGQSTEILARHCIVNQIEFHSVEFDRDSPDVAVAEQRLAEFGGKIHLHFGDAFDVVPLILGGIQQDKPVALVIDGPKGTYALELAMLCMLRHENIVGCFFHDVHQDAYRARVILDRCFPGALYSEDLEFVKYFSFLDEACWARQSQVEEFSDWAPYARGREKLRSYSSTLGFVSRPSREALVKALKLSRRAHGGRLNRVSNRAIAKLKKMKRMV